MHIDMEPTIQEVHVEEHIKTEGGFSLPRASGLLRLFKSDLFNAWMALQYLHKQEQVGIHYYICNRLRDLPHEDIEFILPQLCHLMITRKISSTPLECLIMDMCRKHTHLSIQILWQLESYLQDFSDTNKEKFDLVTLKRVIRLLKEVQCSSFSKESLREMHFIREGTSNRRRRSFHDDRSTPHRNNIDDLPCVNGTLFGFGVSILAFAMPEACKLLRPLALMEARTPHYADISAIMFPKDRKVILPGASKEKQFQSPPILPRPTPFNSSSPSMEDLQLGNAFSSIPGFFEKAAKQFEANISLPSFNRKNCSSIRLLYHAEMQFVSSLLDISKGLCNVPSKEQKQKALHVNLNLVDHSLPALVCLPFLCNLSKTKKHHRIVRIPPNEATILNSAERVPFLVFIETVEDSSLDDLSTLKRIDALESDNLSHCTSNSSVQESTENEHDLIEARTPLFPPTIPDDPIAEQMRLAAIMLAQLNRQAGSPNSNLEEINNIRNKLIHEIERLEKDGMIEALSGSGNIAIHSDEAKVTDSDAFNQPAVIRDDPSASVFNENWETKKSRIRASSQFGHLPSWNLLSVVVKSGVDMRQEKFACQLIHMIKDIWIEEEVECWCSPHHNVLVSSFDGGLIETIPNTISIHSIKKSSFNKFNNSVCSLKEYFIRKFGQDNEEMYKKAKLSFIKSLAGYSLISYILQIKDRHNGNILIDNEGHIIHIDFGFMLSNSPGGTYVGGFETAPFKLTSDYIEILGNINHGNPEFDMFRYLFMAGFLALRKHHERLLTLLEVTLPRSSLPCLEGRETVLGQIKSRLLLSATDKLIEQSVDRLITSSAYNMFTRLYDSFQYYSNGIL